MRTRLFRWAAFHSPAATHRSPRRGISTQQGSCKVCSVDHRRPNRQKSPKSGDLRRAPRRCRRPFLSVCSVCGPHYGRSLTHLSRAHLMLWYCHQESAGCVLVEDNEPAHGKRATNNAEFGTITVGGTLACAAVHLLLLSYQTLHRNLHGPDIFIPGGSVFAWFGSQSLLVKRTRKGKNECGRGSVNVRATLPGIQEAAEFQPHFGNRFCNHKARLAGAR